MSQNLLIASNGHHYDVTAWIQNAKINSMCSIECSTISVLLLF